MTLEELIIPNGTYYVEFGKHLLCRDESYKTDYAKYVKDWYAFDIDHLFSENTIQIINHDNEILIIRVPCISYSSIFKYKKEDIFYIPDEDDTKQPEQLPDFSENEILAIADTIPKVNDLDVLYKVGDYVYLTQNEEQMRYRRGYFKPEPCIVPIMRKIVSIVIGKDRVSYQLSGCGIHFYNRDVGCFVFNTYEDANRKINGR